MPTHMLACPACRLFLRVVKNGVVIEEGMPLKPAEDHEAGCDLAFGNPCSCTAKPAEWAPYKLWGADLWACEGCGFQLIAGFANRPIAEHYQPTYQACRDASPPLVRIDDCPGGSFNEDRARELRELNLAHAARRYPMGAGQSCGEKSAGYICTRPTHDTGPHVAHVTAHEAGKVWADSGRACNESAKGVGSR